MDDNEYPNTRREGIVKFRVTDAEKELINEAAKNRGVSASQFLRKILIDANVLPREAASRSITFEDLPAAN